MVLCEIDNKFDISNPHGIDIKKCLVLPPIIHSFKNSYDNFEPKDMWLILCEDPVNNNKGMIVYDETEKSYGLAFKDNRKHSFGFTFIGHYEGFLDTLMNM